MRRMTVAVVLVLTAVLVVACGGHHPTTTASGSTSASYHFRVENDRRGPVTILDCVGPCKLSVPTGPHPAAKASCNTTCRRQAGAVSLAAGQTHEFAAPASLRNGVLILDGQGTVVGCVPVAAPGRSTPEPTIRLTSSTTCTFRAHRPGLLHRISRWFHRL